MNHNMLVLLNNFWIRLSDKPGHFFAHAGIAQRLSGKARGIPSVIYEKAPKSSRLKYFRTIGEAIVMDYTRRNLASLILTLFPPVSLYRKALSKASSYYEYHENIDIKIDNYLNKEEYNSIKLGRCDMDVTEPLQNALNDVGLNGTLHLIPGTYFINRPLRPKGNCNIKGYEKAKIRHNKKCCAIDVGGLNKITIDGVIFTTSTTSNWLYDNSNRHPSVSDDSGKSNGIKFINCTFIDTNYMGILFYNGGSGHIVKFCSFIRTGRDGVDIRGGANHKIVHNYAEDTGDDAFVVTGASYSRNGVKFTDLPNNVTISDNYACRPGSINLGGSGIRAGVISGNISNNVIYSPGRYGIVISSLDEDGGARPDDILCFNNSILITESKFQDSSAYAFRDVDHVRIFGGTISCRSRDKKPIGNAFYIRNNTLKASNDPSTKLILIEGVNIFGAKSIICQKVFNSKKIVINDGIWQKCLYPTLWLQKNGYNTGKFILKNITAEDPLSYAFFYRAEGEPKLEYFEASNLNIKYSSDKEIIHPPFKFGSSHEKDKVGTVIIKNCGDISIDGVFKDPISNLIII